MGVTVANINVKSMRKMVLNGFKYKCQGLKLELNIDLLCPN